MLVEFSDHLELIEAPIGDARTLAVIAMARKLRPAKPLTKARVTHHHFDHTGGLRAAISEGLTIVAHETSKPLFEELARRPHTIKPDALARNPKPLHLETVGDRAIFEDALRPMAIYHVVNHLHADSAIMIYFLKERILVQGDPYNPSNPAHVWAPNLYDNIRSRRLTVATHVPIHGAIVSNAVFLKAVQSATSAATR